MQTASSQKYGQGLRFTTFNWFCMNALGPWISNDYIGSCIDYLETQLSSKRQDIKARLLNNIKSLKSKSDISYEIPYVPNDTQVKDQRRGPWYKVFIKVLPNISKDDVEKALNGAKKEYLFDFLEKALENYWDDDDIDYINTAPKVFMAELPAGTRGFLNITQASETSKKIGAFKAPIRYFAIATYGIILTYLHTVQKEKATYYLFLGLSPKLWISIGESAENKLGFVSSIKRAYRSIIELSRRNDVETPMFEIGQVYAASRVASLHDVTIEDVLLGRYWIDLLSLTKPRKTQNFLANLDTTYITDYVVALRKTRLHSALSPLISLLNYHRDLNMEVLRDYVKFVNAIITRFVRFTSNGECSEVSEIAYLLKSGLSGPDGVLYRIKQLKTASNNDKKIENIHEKIARIEGSLRKIRC
ncbi:MAG: hypothetical protein L7H08_09270 [Vulcanisaeta sp.]|nr:hypothetical protein [Vulcanisaeta sp.]